MDEYLNRINISFPLSGAKDSVGSGNTSSSSRPLLYCSRHSHTIPKASSRGRVQSRPQKSHVQSSFEYLQSFHNFSQSLIALSVKNYVLIFKQICHLAPCDCCHMPLTVSLWGESLSLPALCSSQEVEVLPASSCTHCAFTLLGALDCTDCSMAWPMGAQTWAQDCRSSYRRREGTAPPCVWTALLPLQPTVLPAIFTAKANCWLSTALTSGYWVDIEYRIFYIVYI